jgi:hypothetical protein
MTRKWCISRLRCSTLALTNGDAMDDELKVLLLQVEHALLAALPLMPPAVPAHYDVQAARFSVQAYMARQRVARRLCAEINSTVQAYGGSAEFSHIDGDTLVYSLTLPPAVAQIAAGEIIEAARVVQAARPIVTRPPRTTPIRRKTAQPVTQDE